MPARIPLPPDFGTGSFRVSEGRQAGLSRKRLRGRDLARPFHGIRSSRVPDTMLDRAYAYTPLLRPGDRFSHTTAALLWNLPIPDEWLEVHVTALAPSNAPRGRAVRGHQTTDAVTAMRHGLPVSTPAALFRELSTILPLDELVVAGDALVLDPYVLDPHDIRPYSSLDELHASCGVEGARGIRRARTAFGLLRLGAESRPETLLRLLLGRAGFPEPEVNVELFDQRGRFIARVDLLYRDVRVIVEYDGEQHRTSSAQYERDMIRLERLIAAGWRVVRVRKRGLFVAPDHTVARVRDAFATAR